MDGGCRQTGLAMDRVVEWGVVGVVHGGGVWGKRRLRAAAALGRVEVGPLGSMWMRPGGPLCCAAEEWASRLPCCACVFSFHPPPALSMHVTWSSVSPPSLIVPLCRFLPSVLLVLAGGWSVPHTTMTSPQSAESVSVPVKADCHAGQAAAVDERRMRRERGCDEELYQSIVEAE